MARNTLHFFFLLLHLLLLHLLLRRLLLLFLFLLIPPASFLVLHLIPLLLLYLFYFVFSHLNFGLRHREESRVVVWNSQQSGRKYSAIRSSARSFTRLTQPPGGLTQTPGGLT